ncbi:MAG: serine hydrolase [Clostridiales bacterium]|nr:serine hydrolase [Clostridiales bacterium]
MDQKELYRYIQENQPNICQISIMQNGQEIYSAEWNGYQRNDCTHIMSATKSIIALLTGIAIDHGMIGSVEDKVLSFFPEYSVKRGEKTIYDVTVKHLLTMRAPYKGKGDPWTKVCSSDDWTTASLDFLGGKKGITEEFDYRTVCLHILSGILFQATGMKTADFANQYLFLPLGIAEHRNYYAESAEEHKEFTISKSPKENIWFADPDGLGTPGYGLCMSASDMVKIGQLCLNKGVWEGKRIISEGWIDEMTNPREVESKYFRGMQYGYLWWVIHPEKKIYAAIGNSGNVIYVNPEKDIVVAVSSYFKPTVFDRVDFIEDTLLPCVGLLPNR